MAADASETPIDAGDPRVQVGIGLLIVVLSMVGLAGWIPLFLEDWARWFLLIGLFLFGSSFTMYALTQID